MPKEIEKEKFIKLSLTSTRNFVARYFCMSDMTAQRIADELNIQFKKYKPTGRKKIKLI